MSKLFKKLTPVGAAQETFFNNIFPVAGAEVLPLEESTGRVVSEDVVSPVDVPHYARAAMDGYALKAGDTTGASVTSPVVFSESDGLFLPQSCVRVHTGSPLPEGADAVVMIEDTRRLDNGLVEVTAQLHPFENIGETGEDIRRDELVFRQGHVLRPVDISVMASLRTKHVKVCRKPVVSIIPTGEELVPRGIERELVPGEILETNSLMAQLYVKKWGGTPLLNRIVTDQPELIKEAVLDNLTSDMIIICGGTSVGGRDHVPAVISEIGKILTRGIKASPGKPTTTGLVENVPVLCMPGYPVAGYIALQLFAKQAVKTLAHLPVLPETTATLPLAEKITSKSEYLTFTRVRIEGGSVVPLMSSGASILSSISRSDGYIVIPENIEGYAKGEEIDVILTD